MAASKTPLTQEQVDAIVPAPAEAGPLAERVLAEAYRSVGATRLLLFEAAAALSADPQGSSATPIPGGAPDGWVLVPKEPSDEMLDAACSEGPDTNNGPFSYDDARRAWAAMLQAAPSTDTPAGEGK